MDEPIIISEKIYELLTGQYLEIVDKMIDGGKEILIVDFNDLDEPTKNKLRKNYIEELIGDTPSDILTGVMNMRARERGITKFYRNVYMAFKNITPSLKIRELTSDYANGLIQINGIVISTTPPHSIIIKAHYRCSKCGEVIVVNQYTTEIMSPMECLAGCKAKRGFVLLETESEIDDYQELIIQENPEEVNMGVVPRTMRARVIGKHLLDMAKAGDLVDMSCALIPIPMKRGKGRIFEWCLDVNYMELLNKDAYSVELSEEDEESINQTSMMPNLEEIFRESIFPSIYGHEQVKDSFILGMFGAPDQRRQDIIQRGTINILLVGDPSTGKTRMLQTITFVAPKALYASGKGASGVGLTAAAVQDNMGWRLEAGALVLADGGVCCIDEIEKISAEDRDKILEAMSVQTVSINKATIHTTLRARTSVFAAANPVGGRYNEYEYISDNISLPPPILSRFDLIFIMKDKPDQAIDEEIAKRVFEEVEREGITLTYNHIKKYILYSKRINPILDSEARAALMGYYIPLRMASGKQKNSPIAITTRQLEGLKRLTQASARLHLRRVATIYDANTAIALMKKSMEEVMTDPTTGELDSDILMGKPKAEGDKIRIIMIILRKMLPDMVDIETLAMQVEPLGIDRTELDRLLRKCVIEPEISVYEPENGYWTII